MGKSAKDLGLMARKQIKKTRRKKPKLASRNKRPLEKKKKGRDVKGRKPTKKIDGRRLSSMRVMDRCPYCQSTDIVKAGFRVKKHEKVQLYYCNRCGRKFTPLISKGKTYPIKIILESLILRNRLNSPVLIAEKMRRKYGFKISPDTISNWDKEYRRYTPFARMRDYLALKLNQGIIKPKEVVAEYRLFHGPGQIYDFGFHRAKAELVIEETYRNYKLRAIKDFLELVIAECPHQVFRESRTRASEIKDVFNLDGVRITRKENRASEMARFVMQAVANHKERHREIQKFMLFCDSTTLAVEVPVLLDKDDIFHFRDILNFDVPLEIKEGEVITGHIDIVQLRNGAIHIIDFKPSARKEKPIEQLTLYALALSRLTGLRLYNFKCAWFDKDDYFEFFPLHVVYKKKRRKGKGRPHSKNFVLLRGRQFKIQKQKKFENSDTK